MVLRPFNTGGKTVDQNFNEKLYDKKFFEQLKKEVKYEFIRANR